MVDVPFHCLPNGYIKIGKFEIRKEAAQLPIRRRLFELSVSFRCVERDFAFEFESLRNCTGHIGYGHLGTFVHRQNDRLDAFVAAYHPRDKFGHVFGVNELAQWFTGTEHTKLFLLLRLVRLVLVDRAVEAMDHAGYHVADVRTEIVVRTVNVAGDN